MASVTTTGQDISALLSFSKAQLSARLSAIDTLDSEASSLVEAIIKAITEEKMSFVISGENLLTLTFDVPADSGSGLPAVKGKLVLSGQISSSRIDVSSAEFISADPVNDLHLLLTGALSYQPLTGKLSGNVTEVSVSTFEAMKTLTVIGRINVASSSDSSDAIRGIRYTEAGITTEIMGRLSVDDDHSMSGMVRSLSIYDGNSPVNKISWRGHVDYAKLVAMSASLDSVKDIFSSQDMASLFSGNDVFDIQTKEALSGALADVQTSWFGQAGNDLMRGGPGRELFDGGTGSDRLFGGGGNDTLNGNAGNDRVYGDDGNDQLEGDQGNDRLDGGNGLDRVLGGAGNDRMIGGDGDDSLYGDSGNDWLYGGMGNDVMIGGEGNDVYLDLQGDNDIEDEEGNNRIVTGSGNDSIYSTGSGSGKINAGDGNNRVVSGEGNDKVVTGEGDDDIASGGGNDRIRAGAGNDKLDAGAGVDLVFGGAGADKFILSAVEDEGYVRIADFKAAEGDQIGFDTFVFTALNADLRAQQFVANNTGVATTADQRLIFDTRNGKLYYDEDGSGSLKADHIGTLIGATALGIDQIAILG